MEKETNMVCQAMGCLSPVTWREVDHYVQQKQEFTYFHYYCDKHKEQVEAIKTVGHKKKFYPL